MNKITDEKLKKYFSITKEALAMAEKAPKEDKAEDILDLVRRYVSDAEHFNSKKDKVNAFAALNYAHGLLDCCARLKFIKVNDSRLFIVDDE